MTTVELFLKLNTSQKDQFCDDLVAFGLISEMNPKAWNKSVKKMIKKSKGTLKKLYQSFQHLDAQQRARFYDSFFEALIHEQN